MLEIGIDSYISVEDADNLIHTRLLSTNDLRVLWDSLSEDDKEVLIRSVTEKYDTDAMIYIGKKVSPEQTLQFPREIEPNRIVECPTPVKVGLLMQGLRDVADASSEESQLIENGVTSYKIKDASISFDVSEKNKAKTVCGIYKDIWYKYFSTYSYIS